MRIILKSSGGISGRTQVICIEERTVTVLTNPHIPAKKSERSWQLTDQEIQTLQALARRFLSIPTRPYYSKVKFPARDSTQIEFEVEIDSQAKRLETYVPNSKDPLPQEIIDILSEIRSIVRNSEKREKSSDHPESSNDQKEVPIGHFDEDEHRRQKEQAERPTLPISDEDGQEDPATR